MAYLYQHIRLDTNTVFYIGIGGLNKFDNYKRSNSKSDRNSIWRKITSKTSYKVEIVEDNLSREEALLKEPIYIKKYGRLNNKTGILSNMTDGGEGALGCNLKQTEEHIRKRSISLIGRKRPEHVKKAMSRIGKSHSDISREKISKATKGSNNPMYGKKHTKEALDKISKLVLNLETGIFYDSAKEACLTTIYKYDYFKMMLRGDRRNKTNFNYI